MASARAMARATWPIARGLERPWAARAEGWSRSVRPQAIESPLTDRFLMAMVTQPLCMGAGGGVVQPR